MRLMIRLLTVWSGGMIRMEMKLRIGLLILVAEDNLNIQLMPESDSKMLPFFGTQLFVSFIGFFLLLPEQQ